MGILGGEWWSAKECARRIGRDETTLRSWRRKDRGPPYHRVEGRIYYKPEDVSLWLNERRA